MGGGADRNCLCANDALVSARINSAVLRSAPDIIAITGDQMTMGITVLANVARLLSGIPFRIGALPEVTIITLRKS